MRNRLNYLSHTIKKLSIVPLRKILFGHVEKWRNKIKSNLYYFIQRFFYPLKELDVEGRRYLVSLENFPDPSMDDRTFTVHQE